ncbi:acyl-CoA thioesterase [Blastococcus sp. SYSU DS0973]
MLDVLALEEIDRDLYRSTLLFTDPFPLYGGQVAAQALYAAGRTLGADRLPHSLHGYFLRSGDSARPTIFRVDRDRDGGSFSARRVVAVQGGDVIFSMSASFSVPGPGPDQRVQETPTVEAPDALPRFDLPRLFSMAARRPDQPFPAAHWPTRFWARSTVALPDDPLVHACVLTYLPVRHRHRALGAARGRGRAGPEPGSRGLVPPARPARRLGAHGHGPAHGLRRAGLVHRLDHHTQRRAGRQLHPGDAVPAGSQPVPPGQLTNGACRHRSR